MKNNKPNKFVSFFKRHKVFSITLILFLVVVPLILIPTTYIYQIVSSKPVLFGDKKIKAVKLDKQEYFDINVTLYNITEPMGDTPGEYIFDYKLTPKSAVNTISNVRFTGQLSVVNDNYTSMSGDTLTSLESHENNKLIFKWDYNMEKTLLPFLKPKGPKLYLKIMFSYDMAPPLQGNPREETIYVEVPYS